jgi:large conductance mechanosensitive channel
MFAEFRKFAMRGSVVDLAVGVVIGAAFTAIVNSLVKDMIMPPLGVVLGGIDFSNFFFVLKGTHAVSTLKAAQDAGAVTINYGNFLGTIGNFLIVAFVLFLVVRQLNRMFASKEPPPPPPPPPEELAVLREIRDLLKERSA